MKNSSQKSAGNPESALIHEEQKELVRLFTCGTVDDGKSTLIGRILYDAKLLPADILAAVERDSKRYGTTGDAFDPALLLDGLQAEREQGITIDVAYRYFHTQRRTFIVADTPGHEQYTRNMATGASTADLAIILVDATHGVREQTKRHAFIASLLGIQHVIVAVNKMDLAGYSEEAYENVKQDFTAFASRLEVRDLHIIPLSALQGDNVVEPSSAMPWYRGATLLHMLETVHVASDRNMIDFRFPVQHVLRPNAEYRGYAGTMASGVLRKGDEVLILPSHKRSTVRSIDTFSGSVEEAFAPMAVTIRLEDERDISRGDMLVAPKNVPRLSDSFEAMMVWMEEEPLVTGKEYFFKHTTSLVAGSIDNVRYTMDVNTLRRKDADRMKMNDVGRCAVSLRREIAFDSYNRNRVTGAFIVIDRLSNATVGAGMILDRRVEEEGVMGIDTANEEDQMLRSSLKAILSADHLSEEERLNRIIQIIHAGDT